MTTIKKYTEISAMLLAASVSTAYGMLSKYVEGAGEPLLPGGVAGTGDLAAPDCTKDDDIFMTSFNWSGNTDQEHLDRIVPEWSSSRSPPVPDQTDGWRKAGSLADFRHRFRSCIRSPATQPEGFASL